MAENKIQGKFYPLQHQEWLRACQELTPAQKDVLYYIRTLDPRNNGIELTAAVIARDLSTPEHKVHRQTVSRALKELDRKGFIDMEVLTVRVTIRPKGYWCNDTAVGNPADSQQDSADNSQQADVNETPMVRGDTNGAMRHQWCDETPSVITTHQARSPRTRQFSKPASDKDSSPYKIYIEFIRSLSEGERESFEKFVREEWKSLKGEEIVSLERFLTREEDIKNWHQRFLNSPAGKVALKKAIATGYDWRQDARFDEWIGCAFNRGYEWVHENEAERSERQAFYDWAFEVNAFEGVCL